MDESRKARLRASRYDRLRLISNIAFHEAEA